MGDSDIINLFEREVMHASITRLSTCPKELETKVNQPATLDRAQRMMQKLDSLDTEFKEHHHALVNVIEGNELLSKE